MSLARKWIVALMFMTLGGFVTAWSLTALRPVIAAEPMPKGDHWQNFDGHWSYWHDADKRWYYTDGTHWYYHNGTGWAVYTFDKLFGAANFLLGGYRPPPPHDVVLPHHDV
ncbi:MAG TPA: hypothetical protein VHV77_14675, partial [Pirellulales bacterium]|nr:hypothetical protein [Pirellulales bacterium]